MAELRNRAPDKGDGDAASSPRRPAETSRAPAETPRGLVEAARSLVEAARHPAADTLRTGAERLRMLYRQDPRLPSRADQAPRTDHANWLTNLRRDQARTDTADPERGHDADRDQHRAEQPRPHADNDRPAETGEPDEIDPRWLAGVPRPQGALPDDTGYAYLAEPRDHAPGDTRHAPDNHRDAEPQPERNPADRLKALVDRPPFQDPFAILPPPDRYGDPLKRADGTPVPSLNGPPSREQTRQGELRDCGVIATLGAVAGHLPGEIASRVTELPDGNYRVRLNEAEWTNDGAAPTGKMIDLTVTPELPVHSATPDRPAFAQGDAPWSPILEKAVAGLDQTWTPDRHADWADAWHEICKADAADSNVANPRTGPPPDGYLRLNQGSESWERAELLTQLTGRESVVRESPDDPKQLLALFARQLRECKPVLVSSRPRADERERLPHNLEPTHVYEVVAVTDEEIVLRNPWNRKHPEPIGPAEFTKNMRHTYATLK